MTTARSRCRTISPTRSAKHDVKFGGDVNSFVDRKDVFAGWTAGRYEFSTLADFDASNPIFYFQGFGLNGQDPFQANTLKPNYQTGIGLYWQDKWQAKPRLTVTYGLRWDGTHNPQNQTPIPGQEVYTGVGPIGQGTKISPVPQHTPNDYKQWGPRVGVAWSVGSTDHPTVVRAAWGLYYAQTPTIFFPQASNGGGSKSTTLFCPTAFWLRAGKWLPLQLSLSPSPPLRQDCVPLAAIYRVPRHLICRPGTAQSSGLEFYGRSGTPVLQRVDGFRQLRLYALVPPEDRRIQHIKLAEKFRHPVGTDQFGRAILASTGHRLHLPCQRRRRLFPGPLPLDCTLTPFSGALELASFSRGQLSSAHRSGEQAFRSSLRVVRQLYLVAKLQQRLQRARHRYFLWRAGSVQHQHRLWPERPGHNRSVQVRHRDRSAVGIQVGRATSLPTAACPTPLIPPRT